jgi:quercetin dioxygenase-like cupin family protein
MKAPIAAIVAVLAITTVAFATTPSGQHPTTPVVGTLHDVTQVNTDRIKFQTKDAVDMASFSVTYDPGGFSGWHAHPGVLLVVVESGSVTRQVGCDPPRTYSAGDSFVESDEQPPGQVSNASTTTPAVLQVMQIVPHGSVRRVDAQPPSC